MSPVFVRLRVLINGRGLVGLLVLAPAALEARLRDHARVRREEYN